MLRKIFGNEGPPGALEASTEKGVLNIAQAGDQESTGIHQETSAIPCCCRSTWMSQEVSKWLVSGL